MSVRFDPRAKLYFLLLANSMLFFHVNTKTEAIMMLLFVIPLFLGGRYRSGIRFAVLYGIFLWMDIFLIPVASGFWLNLISMLSVGIRMLMPCLITGTCAFTTTTPGELVCALRRMHVPEGMIITCAVVIRFFPTVREDYHQIRNAMTLRGIAAGRAAWLCHPVQSLEYILIPLLMNGSNVAQDLSVAALTKGIGLKGKHTCMTQIEMKWYDWGYMTVCTVPVLLFLGGVL